MYLYYFNPSFIDPIKILIVRIISDYEYNYLVENTTEIFQLLIDDNLANQDDILVFSLIKEHSYKIENIILPFSEANLNYVDKYDDHHKLNNLIIDILNKTNCFIFFDLENNELKKNIINYDLSFLINKYI